MQIEHVALWTKQLEVMHDFYVRYFGGRVGDNYTNPNHQFESYFVSFDSGARLELMRMPAIPAGASDLERQFTDWIHVAFSVDSREKVDELTGVLRRDSFV